MAKRGTTITSTSSISKQHDDAKRKKKEENPSAETGSKLQTRNGKISLRILASSKERRSDNLLRITLKSPSTEAQISPQAESSSFKIASKKFTSLVNMTEYINGLLMEQLELGEPPEGYAPRQLALIFAALPSKKKYPDYYKIIERPLSLKTIIEQARAGHYSTMEELMADYETMFKNAQVYNQRGSVIYEDAFVLLEFIKKLTPKLSLVAEREEKTISQKEPSGANELISVDDGEGEGEGDNQRSKTGTQSIPMQLKIPYTPIQELFMAVAQDNVMTMLTLLDRPQDASTAKNAADSRLPTMETITRHYAIWPPQPKETAALDNVRWSVLHCAAYFGAIKVIDALVERCGVGVLESRDALYDSTALAWAAFGKQFEICERLIIAYAVCITVKNWTSQTPLELVGTDITPERMEEWRALLVAAPTVTSSEAHRVSLLVTSLITRVLRQEHAGRPYSALLGAASWRSLAMAKPIVTEFLMEAIRRCRECQRFASLRSASATSGDVTNAVAESILAFLGKSLPREWPLVESRYQTTGIHQPSISGVTSMTRSPMASITTAPLQPPLKRWERATIPSPAPYMPRRLAPPIALSGQLITETVTPPSSFIQLHPQLVARPPSSFGLAFASPSSEQCAGSIFLPVKVFFSDSEQLWHYSWSLISMGDARATSIHVPGGIEVLLLELEFGSGVTKGEQEPEQDFILLHNQTERVEPLAERPRIRFKVHLSTTQPTATFDSVELFQRGIEHSGLFRFATIFLHMHAPK